MSDYRVKQIVFTSPRVAVGVFNPPRMSGEVNHTGQTIWDGIRWRPVADCRVTLRPERAKPYQRPVLCGTVVYGPRVSPPSSTNHV